MRWKVRSKLNHAWDSFFTGGNDTFASSNANAHTNTHIGDTKEEEQQQDKMIIVLLLRLILLQVLL